MYNFNVIIEKLCGGNLTKLFSEISLYATNILVTNDWGQFIQRLLHPILLSYTLQNLFKPPSNKWNVHYCSETNLVVVCASTFAEMKLSNDYTRMPIDGVYNSLSKSIWTKPDYYSKPGMRKLKIYNITILFE